MVAFDRVEAGRWMSRFPLLCGRQMRTLTVIPTVMRRTDAKCLHVLIAIKWRIWLRDRNANGGVNERTWEAQGRLRAEELQQMEATWVYVTLPPEMSHIATQIKTHKRFKNERFLISTRQNNVRIQFGIRCLQQSDKRTHIKGNVCLKFAHGFV